MKFNTHDSYACNTHLISGHVVTRCKNCWCSTIIFLTVNFPSFVCPNFARQCRLTKKFSYVLCISTNLLDMNKESIFCYHNDFHYLPMTYRKSAHQTSCLSHLSFVVGDVSVNLSLLMSRLHY